MTKDNNTEKDQPTEEQQLSDETQTELREISKEELKQILEDHKKWLESDGKEGEQADLRHANLKKKDLKNANLKKANLSGANLQKAVLYEADLQKAGLRNANLQKAGLMFANLQKADLFEANLQKADLEGANLQEALLYRANLQKADLRQANLQQANFMEANLQGAFLIGASLQKTVLAEANMQNTTLSGIEGLNKAKDLKYANFKGATGLLGNEFAQADVTGAKLPDDIKEFKALEIVKETSQNARKIFFAMLLGCVYSWLTIATTTDVRLLTNTASSPLPIIGTEIPIAGFYWAAPLVLICLYFYFHLYLLKLWEGLSGLPAIFPDGKRLDERAYPWLLNGLVRRHFERLKTERPFIAHIQEWITIFLAWWVVPITMIAFWLRYIPRHEWLGTCFQIGLIVFSVAFSIIFYRLCALTLQGKEKVGFRLQYFWRDKRFYYGVSVVFVCILFSMLSYGAIHGVRGRYHLEIRRIGYHNISQVVPWAFNKVGYDVFADFREQDVSERPINYGLISKEERLEFVKRANLKGRNLKTADMYKAFLVKADCRKAVLNDANLEEANLQQADLRGANLQQAKLRAANLKQADLSDANLQQAELGGANLQQANLRDADLQEADLRAAKLQQANLGSTYLKKAKIIAANLQKAYLNAAILVQADLHAANLQQADLRDANLKQADLGIANLKQANLEQANLQQANLRYANLLEARNLTTEQLSKAKTLYNATLDPELLEQVKKCCPQLLEEPKEETDQKR